MSSYPSLDIVRRSATPELEPRARLGQDTVVAKLIDVSKCTGCKACQSACSEWNDVVAPVGIITGSLQHPPDLGEEAWTVVRFDEVEQPGTGDLEWLIRKESCMHCADPGCLKACPSPGAIVQYGNGIVDFDEANCIGCGYCVKGCPFNIPRYGKEDRKAYKCTMCADRVAVGLEPACVKSCPTEALMFGTKKDMLAHAENRVAELQSLGHAGAGLYDPQGVGGTHVMYVLPHADTPELYSGLPKDPQISPVVKAWRSGVTLFGIGLMAASALAAAVHYLTVGPDEVPAGAEDEAAREAEDARQRNGGAA